jgi:hypothetical protein
MKDNYTIFILCKDFSNRTNEYAKILSQKNISHYIICDLCSIEDDEQLLSDGFSNLTRSPYIKKPSAWDKSFYKIVQSNLLEQYDYFYFIEDDVYSKNYEALISFVDEAQSIFTVDFITKKIRPKSHNSQWKHWQEDYVNEFSNPHQSFNPLCRLSKVLIEKILHYREQHKLFNFHEILFASLCLEHNLSYINYIESSILNKYIGNFRYNPILLESDITDHLIYHPVKDSKSDREKGVVSLDKRR